MRKRKILVLAVISLCFPMVGKAAEPDYWRSDSLKVVKLLQQADKLDISTNYMIFFARQLKGLPYVSKTLEKNPDERLVVNLRQMDCTTYVESVLALTLCAEQGKTSFEEYCRNLQRIRYKDGDVHYTNRLHYFTCWMEENAKKGIVEIVEGDQELFSATQTVEASYMTTHVSAYPMLEAHKEWIPEIKKMEESITGNQYAYIPKSKLSEDSLLRHTIHDGDIIVILTSKAGLDTSHIGIAVWHDDGLHLLNASSIHHKVVEEPKLFRKYMKQHRSHTGIRVVRPL
ncbi:MAG: N-acetylmuramoyl-L-alanine amidase-like domain-containing protein [Prevotella sp.]|jgi:hypothetical protein